MVMIILVPSEAFNSDILSITSKVTLIPYVFSNTFKRLWVISIPNDLRGVSVFLNWVAAFLPIPLSSISILKIKFSSKYAEFNDIIITSKETNVWQYRPDITTGDRITAKFEDWEKSAYSENIILLVRTIFNFRITNKEANFVLELPPPTE